MGQPPLRGAGIEVANRQVLAHAIAAARPSPTSQPAQAPQHASCGPAPMSRASPTPALATTGSVTTWEALTCKNIGFRGDPKP